MLSLRSLPPGNLRIRPGCEDHFPELEGLETEPYHRAPPGGIPSPVNPSPSSQTPVPIRAIDLIRKKRDGQEMSRAEVEYLVRAYTAGEIPDYQASAWLMAVILRGLTRGETSDLTDAMLRS